MIQTRTLCRPSRCVLLGGPIRTTRAPPGRRHGHALHHVVRVGGRDGAAVLAIRGECRGLTREQNVWCARMHGAGAHSLARFWLDELVLALLP